MTLLDWDPEVDELEVVVVLVFCCVAVVPEPPWSSGFDPFRLVRRPRERLRWRWIWPTRKWRGTRILGRLPSSTRERRRWGWLPRCC